MSSSVLVFMSATGRGFQLEYPSITLHAVSRAESGPSIYCQIDTVDPATENGEEIGEDIGNQMKELVIVPQNIQARASSSSPSCDLDLDLSCSAVEPIFESLSICASLHPDPASLSDDMYDDAFVEADENGIDTFLGDESQELSEVGRVRSDFVNNHRYAPY